MYPKSDEDMKRLNNDFTYHAPNDDQVERYALLRGMAKELAFRILTYCLPSRGGGGRSLALTNLEQAVFWANASIARNEINSQV